ncbi:MAG: folate family ECF transporter S component [Candidatus Atribacteria bacterium]|nr:folate family ECF transporter S component [Candidatus Atribacteria bacterium]
MKNRSHEIVWSGMFIALSVVLTRFASIRIPIGGVESIRIGFGTLPIMVSGILLGPWVGGTVGALADIIGFAISPMGPYFPHFTLTSALYGLLPGLFLQLFPSPTREKRVVWGIIITQVFVGGLLTPYFLHAIFHIPWQLLLFPRLFTVPIHIVIYSLLSLSTLRVPLPVTLARNVQGRS